MSKPKPIDTTTTAGALLLARLQNEKETSLSGAPRRKWLAEHGWKYKGTMPDGYTKMYLSPKDCPIVGELTAAAAIRVQVFRSLEAAGLIRHTTHRILA